MNLTHMNLGNGLNFFGCSLYACREKAQLLLLCLQNFFQGFIAVHVNQILLSYNSSWKMSGKSKLSLCKENF